MSSQVSRCQHWRTNYSMEAKWIWLPNHFNHRYMHFYGLHNFPTSQEWQRRPFWWILPCYTQSWRNVMGSFLLPGFPEVGRMFSDPAEGLWSVHPWSLLQKLLVTLVLLCVLSFSVEWRTPWWRLGCANWMDVCTPLDTLHFLMISGLLVHLLP